jgi:hypothetical protein
MRQSKPKPSLQDRLSIQAMNLRDKANALPPGPMRDEMIRKARQSETASHIDGWLSSPGLQPPR